MNTKPTPREREHLARIKAMPCAVCDAPPPSEAHHITQRTAFSAIPLCPECHRGDVLGLHGQRRAWAVRKMTEDDALYRTVERLCA